MTDPAFIYVIRSPSGRRKIGYSNNPERRRRHVACFNSLRERGRFVIEHTRPVPASLVVVAEAAAHHVLSARRICDEWFDVSVDGSVDAIERGVVMAESGWQPPPSVRGVRVAMGLALCELRAIDDWSFENRVRSRSEAMRRLIQLGLEASAKKPGKK